MPSIHPSTSRKSKANLPNQRWQISPPAEAEALRIAKTTGLLPILAQVLINRGVKTPQAVEAFLHPESLALPSPLEEFPDLAVSLELLEQAIRGGDKITICGDYDADGMTSTALLIRALKSLGATVDYAIPSRMSEGYGINKRMVEDFATEGVGLILTVDNGIAAYEAIALARERGLSVIITDHHDLPPQLPPANAILNPKLLPEDSLYSGLAGVGVAYVLAITLAQQMGQTQNLVSPLLELFTLGTIADLAPLVGVNRRWLQRGLTRLPKSQLVGVRALIDISGSGSTKQTFKPETIGFRLGPRINAVGRIGDPQTVIELLTTNDSAIAQTRAIECEQANQQRQQMCREIEAEAIIRVEASPDLSPLKHRVLVIVEPDWHHGVIGIVASRLVERYGVPVFIGTYEDDTKTLIRGSARSIPEFDVFEALHHCGDLLHKFGGHRAAGGFTLDAENLPKFRAGLSEFAYRCLEPEHLKPLVKVDAQAHFSDISWELYHQIDQLQPCGMGNPEPTFWTPQVQVLDQRVIGQNHLKVTLSQMPSSSSFSAIAWRWAEYFPLPAQVDVAYRLRENTWNGETNLELEIVGIRAVGLEAPSTAGFAQTTARPSQPISSLPVQSLNASFQLPTPQPLEIQDVVLQTPSLQTPNLQTSVSQTPVLQILDIQPSTLQASDMARSPLLPSHEPVLHCPQPPAHQKAVWQNLEALDALLPSLSGDILLYGDQRPYVSAQGLNGTITYDRPQGHCPTILLWTLPPSWTHLGWLMALAHAETVYVRNCVPKLPTAADLRSQLSFRIVKDPEARLNLLELGQKWWVAPSTLVAALRDMEYSCPSFGETASLEQELQRLERWYQCPAQRLSQLA